MSASLPAGIPVDALYDEMKRLAENQNKLKAQIQEARHRGEEQRLASAAEYDRLLAKLRDQLTDVSPESKRRIIHALIHKVVVTKDGCEMHFYVGVDQISRRPKTPLGVPVGCGLWMDHIKKGNALASHSFSLDKKFLVGVRLNS